MFCVCLKSLSRVGLSRFWLVSCCCCACIAFGCKWVRLICVCVLCSFVLYVFLFLCVCCLVHVLFCLLGYNYLSVVCVVYMRALLFHLIHLFCLLLLLACDSYVFECCVFAGGVFVFCLRAFCF